MSPCGTIPEAVKSSTTDYPKGSISPRVESTSASNVVGGTPKAPDPNYINMVQSQTLLKTRNKNHEKETLEKGKSIGETSNPLTIDKPAEIMPKIRKGVFKNTLHNPNARAASNYFVVEDLSQTPCAMSDLEVL